MQPPRGGGTQQRDFSVHSQGTERDTPTRQQAPPERSQETEEGGTPPEQHRALSVHNLREREREGVTPPEQEGEGMALPNRHITLPTQGTRRRKGGAPPKP